VSGRDTLLMRLIGAIVADDEPEVKRLLGATPELSGARASVGASREHASEYYYQAIEHYLYAGDTALHMAGAAYRASIVHQLVGLGAAVDARNHRGAQPLHYAADGIPGSLAWSPDAQRETITALIDAGADPDAIDKSGVTPLHRAVRTRCAGAVAALLAGGADPSHPNKRGSSPLLLATQSTGRGGSGSPEAKVQQEQITRLLTAAMG
jgi:hypothetical protein